VTAAPAYTFEWAAVWRGLPYLLQGAGLTIVISAVAMALAAALGLAFAGIDLRLTPEGEWYCFEANPSPAFTYYEAASGQPIADAVAALLAG
jgi:ABC-type amino acid transport system permease subunit